MVPTTDVGKTLSDACPDKEQTCGYSTYKCNFLPPLSHPTMNSDHWYSCQPVS